mgnify:CR=1 FL=1
MSNFRFSVNKLRKASTHLTEESIFTYDMIVCFDGRRDGEFL